MGEGKLKPGWTRVAFGEFAENVNERVDDPASSGVDVYVGLEHLDPESLKIRRWGSPSDVESTKLRFRPGDIIFGKRRVYQRKLGVAEVDGICSAHALVLRDRPELLAPGFLAFFMQSDLFMERALSISVGSLSPTINWRTLAKQEFILPPIKEQERVVELLLAVEEVKEELQNTKQHSLMIRKALAEHIISKTLPSDLVPISQLCDPARSICYGVIQPGVHVETGIPMLRVCDLEINPIDYESLKRIDPKIHDQYNRSVLRKGDILVSVVGTIGRIHVATEEEEGYNIARAIARIAPNPDCNPSFLALILEAPSLQRTMTAESFETARKTLNLASLEKIKVPLPDITTQNEVVEAGNHAGLEERFIQERIELLNQLPQALWLG